MATYTDNLNLKKPASTDLALISDINGNMDILDVAVDARVPKSDVLGGIVGAVDTMPTASASLEGRVVYYSGTSTSAYRQGLMYRCVETATEGEYEWREEPRCHNITISTADPSGGADGDIWLKYE